MHFEIEAALKASSRLSSKQRTSPWFSECPRLLGKDLRRGVVIKVTPEQFEHNKVAIERMFKAEAIEIFAVAGKNRINIRERDRAEVAESLMNSTFDKVGEELKEGSKAIEMVDEVTDTETTAELEKKAEDRAATTVVTTDAVKITMADTVVPVDQVTIVTPGIVSFEEPKATPAVESQPEPAKMEPAPAAEPTPAPANEEPSQKGGRRKKKE